METEQVSAFEERDDEQVNLVIIEAGEYFGELGVMSGCWLWQG